MPRSPLQQVMAGHGVTQAELAAALGVTQQTVQKVASGRQHMTRPRAERFAHALTQITGQPITWAQVM